jgi:hypothetical protein
MCYCALPFTAVALKLMASDGCSTPGFWKGKGIYGSSSYVGQPGRQLTSPTPSLQEPALHLLRGSPSTCYLLEGYAPLSAPRLRQILSGSTFLRILEDSRYTMKFSMEVIGRGWSRCSLTPPGCLCSTPHALLCSPEFSREADQ